MATKAIATWALALQFADLPNSIQDIAVKSIYNWAGCAIGGYTQTAPAVALEVVSSISTVSGNSTILGTDALINAQSAALINGIASHADDYNDSHRDNPIHPSGPVLSVLLAAVK